MKIKYTNIRRLGVYVATPLGFCLVDDFGNLVKINDQTQFASGNEE